MVADKIHESGEGIWPKEAKAKPISGKFEIVTEKILSLQEEDDPAPLLCEWIDFLKPESVLSEESFQACIHDYSKLIDALTRMEDVKRILKKMSVNGIQPDVIMPALFIQIYCKSGNLDRAKESFNTLRAQEFTPDMKAYNSMVIAYINAGRPKEAEALFKDMEMKDIKVTKRLICPCLRHWPKLEWLMRLIVFSHLHNFITAPITLNLEAEDFERIIISLKEGGFQQDARRVREKMEARGFVLSERVQVSLTASQAMRHSNKRKVFPLGSLK